MSKRLVITLIIALVVLNLAFVGFAYYKIKTSASGLAASADTATSNAAQSNNSANLLKLQLAKREIPASDVAGRDLGDLTRSKGDVRTAFTQSANGTATAEYKTTTAANIILSYYRTQLAKNNWILQTATSSQIVFSKLGQTIIINASTADSGVTTYTVTL